jgi:lipid-binding SYLF domain-containing protein
MRHTHRWLLPATLALAMLAGVAYAEVSINDAQANLAAFKKADPTLEPKLRDAAGYVVFPEIKKGAFVFGGAGGEGLLYEGGVPVGKVTLTQVTVGAQAGGQSYSQLIVLEDQLAVDRLKKNNLTLAAQISGVAAASGAALNAKYEHGVAVFVLPHGGLMGEVSVGGQRLTFEPFQPRPRS